MAHPLPERLRRKAADIAIAWITLSVPLLPGCAAIDPAAIARADDAAAHSCSIPPPGTRILKIGSRG